MNLYRDAYADWDPYSNDHHIMANMKALHMDRMKRLRLLKKFQQLIKSDGLKYLNLEYPEGKVKIKEKGGEFEEIIIDRPEA